MISVDTALGHIFDLLEPLGSEPVAIRDAGGRVLASPVTAMRDQPPFAASVMDGYAVRSSDALPGARLKVTGESAAGHASDLTLGPGEAIRIFTGAPVPAGADRVVIQEDVRRDGSRITLSDALDKGPYIRPSGADFKAGDTLGAPRRLDSSALTLAAAMNAPVLICTRRPIVALLATGDELVMPGDDPGPDQIIASNGLGLARLVSEEGGLPRLLPIARDSVEGLHAAFDLARGADLIITIGGASVGDHDLVRSAAGERGLDTAFYKVAMRPGKPLMAGRLDDTPIIGLPGNPVSSLVCGHVFLRPALRRLLGFPAAALQQSRAPLAEPVTANGPREHYMRATHQSDGIRVAERQDSGLIGVLAGADVLVVRPPNDGPKDTGEFVDILPLTGRS
ncbi:molybdopterin molybdotransferase MoeA [Ovoidimarina sediminis]|uniref:molybdopterin molybdotransferase MoeA n=1 Tax=Ovoidimarina sediminis TaxID=3079856 RepID=UPI002912E633|nr:gephyrin-like molybdotransferase Glp [Rhodophyticola sp. MJ-SS7]MDU8942180.1 molybdopterin molybdotransferase MoeA [Rhodophyticola sp. MJ-SS7]